jgi:hypothetical protein
MTIEELFGTLQQSVVAAWRKHLRTAKYSKHIALNEFYEQMPDKVDALIEAWMGVNGGKIKSYDNVLQSKNMNTLAYLKELRKVVKQGYMLMNGEAELEAKLDDIVELIDSTLYKVKELSESKVMDLKDFLTEALVNEAQSFLDGCESYPSNWDLIDIFDETDGGKPAKLKNVDWAYYFDDEDFVERNKQKIIKQFTDFFAACNSIQNVDCGNVGEGGFNDEMFREEIGIEPDECGVGLFKDGDDGTWTIITFTKEIDSLPKPQQTALLNMMSKYENSGWYYVEYFDAV